LEKDDAGGDGSTPSCDDGGKEEKKKRKRISLAPARKKAVGRIGMAVHEGWSEKNVREL
jgi:hypothetical protein